MDAGMEDLLTKLPENLIHLILGLLTTKDAVKASFVCKSLQSAWLSSCPALHFHLPRGKLALQGKRKRLNLREESQLDQGKLNRFNKYVSNTMDRVSKHRIASFKYLITWIHYYSIHPNSPENAAMFPPLDKWIGIALDCHVAEIFISLPNEQLLPTVLLERLVSNSFLKSLDLVWEGSALSESPLLDSSFIINLPCLQSLSLIRFRIDEVAFQGLIRGCPSLEHLAFIPPRTRVSLPEVKISHLKLRSLFLGNDSYFRKVEVDAPCLDKFHYDNHTLLDHHHGVTLNSTTLKNLKCLSLFLHSLISKEFLSDVLLPKCTALETLNIQLCNDVGPIKISSPVKNITINYLHTAEIEIDCPMLLSLHWASTGRTLLLPSLSVMNHQPNFAGHLHLEFGSQLSHLSVAFFLKLNKFLPTSRMAAMSFCCSLILGEGDDQNLDTESLPTSAVKIELLYLMVTSGLPESYYSFIINGFLSTCHPDTILLAPVKKKQRPFYVDFIEFFLEKLENWKDGDGCYCSSKINCWKHQLKRVEIQECNSKVVEDKDQSDHYIDCYHDFGILAADLPTVLPSFRIKFQWN